MSEGYQCDRCGSTHGGSPDTMLLVGDGRPRDRPGLIKETYEGRAGPFDGVGDAEFDLCPACRNDLKKWWSDGGGDVTEVSRWEDDLVEKVEQGEDKILSEKGDSK